MPSALSRDSGDPLTLRRFAETMAFIVGINGLGAGSAVLAGSGGQSDWYKSLEKPSFNPPSWVFAPAWTTLYTMMGISFSILWRARHDKSAATPAMQLFSIQLILNLLWSFLFFRWQNPRASFIEILILDAAIVLTIVAAWRVSKVAALLLVPYLCWSAFATVLNGAIWRLNR